MMNTDLQKQLAAIISAYALQEVKSLEPIGQGLIHQTWKIDTSKGTFVLQQINSNVFKDPYQLASNIYLIQQYLTNTAAAYLFVAPLPIITGDYLYKYDNQFFRLFPFVEGSISYTSVSSAEQAYAAAQQFGRFTKLLSGFDASLLKETIPRFHDLELRYNQFSEALLRGNSERIVFSKDLVDRLLAEKSIAEKYLMIKEDAAFPKRVIHHDTKISNVLFNDTGKALCIIDLDTIMPGYFISDVGDMMRTYLAEATEEETDIQKIQIREDIYPAIMEGYLSEMGDLLTGNELEALHYSGEFMIYMQSLRFLTDYLNNDTYYGARYPLHNYNRALNQYTLLKKYQQQVG